MGLSVLARLAFLISLSPLLSAQGAMESFKCQVPRVSVARVVTANSPSSGSQAVLSPNDVSIFVGRNPSFADPASVYWSCSDGVASGNALATPGGDAGEFLMGLSLYGGTMQKFYPDYQLTQSEVSDLFQLFVSSLPTSRGFYMHMDLNVYQSLQAELVPILGPNPNITNVPEANQEEVLAYVTDPNYVGCAHIHYMMQFPVKYNISTSVVTSFLTAFYQHLWNSDEESTKAVLAITKPVPTDGSRLESGFILLGAQENALDITDKCKGKAPVMSPSTPSGPVFLAQPQFVGGIQESVVFFFSRQLQAVIGEQDVTSVNIAPQMAALYALHMQLFTTNVVQSKPVYRVTVVVNNSSNLTRLLIASVVSVVVCFLLFASVAYIKFRQLKEQDSEGV